MTLDRLEQMRRSKMIADQRYLVLKPIDASGPKTSLGTIDPRLLQGGNNAYLKRDLTGLWGIYYEHGTPPGALKQKFTSFDTALKFMTDYFSRRNIQIAEIVDKWD